MQNSLKESAVGHNCGLTGFAQAFSEGVDSSEDTLSGLVESFTRAPHWDVSVVDSPTEKLTVFFDDALTVPTLPTTQVDFDELIVDLNILSKRGSRFPGSSEWRRDDNIELMVLEPIPKRGECLNSAFAEGAI
jgi:hypothetical protein